MDENYAQLWQKLSAALKPEVSPDTFKRWFSAVKLVQATEDAFTFRVPNNIYQFWIESNYLAALQSAVAGVLGAPRKILFTIADASAPFPTKAPDHTEDELPMAARAAKWLPGSSSRPISGMHATSDSARSPAA